MFKNTLLAIFIITPTLAVSQSMDSIQKATNLGSILGSETYCGLTYNQDAISKWIDENTDPADMSFSGSLEMMTEGTKYNLEGQSDSAKTAHCRSIERTARHYGFIK